MSNKTHKKIRKSGVLHDYTPIGIVVLSIITIVFLVLTSLLLYAAFTYGRGLEEPILNAAVGMYY